MDTHTIFTNDLVEEILLWLPVRDLLRLRCVSKSWCALIDSTRFIKKHHQIQYAISLGEDDVPLLLISQSQYLTKPAQFYLVSKKQGDAILCLTPDLDRDRMPNVDRFRCVCCMGVVNGVVGLCWCNEKLGLWNPATREFKVVPPPRPSHPDDSVEFGLDIVGLGFDRKSEDFKIVRSMNWKVVKGNDGMEVIEHICEMYSLNTNSWTRLELPLSARSHLWVTFSSTNGYHNGVYYWTAAMCDSDCNPLQCVIISFDFSTEAFKCLDPPHAVVTAAKNLDDFEWTVGQYMELLATIFSRQNSAEAVCSFEIWVACKPDAGDDKEISLSWQHLFTIGPHHSLDSWSFVAFRMDGDVLLTVEGEKAECNLYNPRSRTFTILGFLFDSGYNYVESLFPLSKRHVRSDNDLNRLKKRKKAHTGKDATFTDERSNKVLESFESKYYETQDFASPPNNGGCSLGAKEASASHEDTPLLPQTHDDDYFSVVGGLGSKSRAYCLVSSANNNYRRPTASHHTNNSSSDTPTHNCGCCQELVIIKQRFDELRRVVSRGEPIPYWVLEENFTSRPSQPSPSSLQ